MTCIDGLFLTALVLCLTALLLLMDRPADLKTDPRKGDLPMNPTQALKLALDLIDDEIHRIAVDANLHDFFNAQYPAALKASARRKQLRQARQILLTVNLTLQGEQPQ
jgi:hypothetical protein